MWLLNYASLRRFRCHDLIASSRHVLNVGVRSSPPTYIFRCARSRIPLSSWQCQSQEPHAYLLMARLIRSFFLSFGAMVLHPTFLFGCRKACFSAESSCAPFESHTQRAEGFGVEHVGQYHDGDWATAGFGFAADDGELRMDELFANEGCRLQLSAFDF